MYQKVIRPSLGWQACAWRRSKGAYGQICQPTRPHLDGQSMYMAVRKESYGKVKFVEVI